jgi:hypothetical protein
VKRRDQNVAPKNTTREEPLGEPRAPIYPLSVTSVVEKEAGSLEVNCSGEQTHLEGEEAHAFKLVVDSAYRAAQQEQPTVGKRALQLVRKMGALG